MAARFLTLTDVAETLNVSLAQVKALVRGGALPAIKIGGRGAWRVEGTELEAYIQRMYDQTREFIGRDDVDSDPDPVRSGDTTGLDTNITDAPELTHDPDAVARGDNLTSR
ncbi:hypothetical protein BH24ACT8_BH24ACT8_10310 [soil metagenome]|jgi:excisionase family DNA binding protein